MSPRFGPPALYRALTASDSAQQLVPGVDIHDLDPLPARGLDNDHVAIRGTGTVLRIPRWPLAGMRAQDALALRAERFRRAAPCGHVPVLHAVLPPDAGLPLGALLVEEIAGPSARVPDDMAALADALAALHAVPLPTAQSRPPLPDTHHPAADLIDRIETQSKMLDAAGASGTAQRLVADEIAAARRWIDRALPAAEPICLVATDTHPGNFLMGQDGRAILVDLDKACYGAPAVDLAHASLPTSIFWATGDWDGLTEKTRTDFYRRYLATVPTALATTLQPWLAPLARLTWLRTTTWAAGWRVAQLPALRPFADLETLVDLADRRTAALIDTHNVERMAATVPTFDDPFPT